MRSRRKEIIPLVRKRRRFSVAEKQRLVAATLAPGGRVAAVAREAGISATLLYGWRQRMGASVPKGFVPVRIAPEVAAGGGMLEIEFAGGTRMRISGAMDIAVMAAAIAALARGQRR